MGEISDDWSVIRLPVWRDPSDGPNWKSKEADRTTAIFTAAVDKMFSSLSTEEIKLQIRHLMMSYAEELMNSSEIQKNFSKARIEIGRLKRKLWFRDL